MRARQFTSRVTKRAPAVSVCVPTWNRAHFIGTALDSILVQTFADLEVVIVDDASTDHTRDVVAAFKDSRVRYHRNSRRAGIAHARNTCLSIASGRFVAWLDSDDVYLNDALATLVRVIEQHPNVGLVHAGFALIDAKGNALKGWPLPFGDEMTEPGRHALVELTLANYITTTTVLTRREIYDTAGGFAPQMRNTCEDWDLWLRCALVTDFAFTPTVVTHVRLHGGNGQRSDRLAGRRLAAEIRAIERFFSAQTELPRRSALERRARAALAARILTHAGHLLLRGRLDAAGRTLARLRRHAPDVVPARTVRRVQRAAVDGDEFGYQRESRAVFRDIARVLRGSRFASGLRKTVALDSKWESASLELAQVLRRITAADARVAVVDKWDPTILHLSRRRGCHFPDLGLHPDGYPADSAGAIAHLERLRRRGITHLAIPSPALWWLQHYAGFHEHLRSSYRRAWDDGRSVVFALQRGAVS